VKFYPQTIIEEIYTHVDKPDVVVKNLAALGLNQNTQFNDLSCEFHVMDAGTVALIFPQHS